MTPLECVARALAENFKAQSDRLGFVATDAGRYPVLDGCFDMQEAARAVLEAIREPIEDASTYLKADAEAWELGAKGAPHEVYLMECGRLRRAVAEKIDMLLAEGANA